MKDLVPLTKDQAIFIERKVFSECEKPDSPAGNNWRFWLLYSRKDGAYHRMSPREWIERYIKIRNKKGEIVPLILNDAQRRLEAEIVHMERQERPVRIVILKARQMGFSTYVQARMFELMMRTAFKRALIIAHRRDTSRLLLNMARTMLSQIVREDGERWDFAMDSRSTGRLRWAEPINSEVEITSAEVAEPGHGDTCQYVHLSETSRWPDAEIKAKGVMQIVPDAPRTYAFNESTANGDTGYFREEFWNGWNERHIPITDHRRSTPWVSHFYPWFQHQEYRWTRTWGIGQELPIDLEREIMSSLDEDEKLLLETKYFLRRRGYVTVDVDQLAWRRLTIRAKLGSNLAAFQEQYPANPEEAFFSSGSPAFDNQKLRRLLNAAEQNPPVWKGECQEVA